MQKISVGAECRHPIFDYGVGVVTEVKAMEKGQRPTREYKVSFPNGRSIWLTNAETKKGMRVKGSKHAKNADDYTESPDEAQFATANELRKRTYQQILDRFCPDFEL